MTTTATTATAARPLRCPHCQGRLIAEAQHLQFGGDCDHHWVGWGCENCGTEWDVNGDQTTAPPPRRPAAVGAGGGSM